MLMIGFSRKISIMLIASVMLLATSCIKDEKHTSDDTTMVSIGQKAPDFTVEMLGGEEIALSDLQGDVVLLTFWDP